MEKVGPNDEETQRETLFKTPELLGAILTF